MRSKMARRNKRRPSSPFDPHHWPVWCLIGLLRILVLLPYRVQLAIGGALGALMLRGARRRVRIARLNITRCFPALDAAAHEALLRAHFEALGIMVMEIGLSWWGSDARLAKLARYEGLEHLEAALAQGRGAILLSAHFTPLEVGGRLMQQRCRFHPMYKPSRNPVMEHVMRARRLAHYETLIRMDDVRQLMRSLRDNASVWYAPDQGFLGKGRLMVPFFGIDAPTNPATARIARLTGAPVVPFFIHRLPGAAGYQLRLLPALDGFPTDDPEADALRINQLIEAEVARTPEQYLWAHNRFKWSRDGSQRRCQSFEP